MWSSSRLVARFDLGLSAMVALGGVSQVWIFRLPAANGENGEKAPCDVGQNQWYHFGQGEITLDWDVHWGLPDLDLEPWPRFEESGARPPGPAGRRGPPHPPRRWPASWP